LKFYSCVGSNHTTLDAIRELRARRPFKIEEIEQIEVFGSQVTVDHVGWKYRPEGITSAQLNLPYCVATLLLEDDVFVDQFSDAMLASPDRIALADKVKVSEDPAITAKGSKFRHLVRVRVSLKDGTALEKTVEAPRGSERSFASESDVVEKFQKLAGHVLPDEQVVMIRDAILSLEKLPDARALARLLVKN
jgi:aconitate decarboxylase